MSQEIFTVNLKAEPSPELREKLRRYLHIRYSGPRQRSYDPGVEGVAYMHNRTVIKLCSPDGGKPWRISCFSNEPGINRKPEAYTLPKGQKGQTTRIARLKPGTEIKVGQQASQAEQLESQVRDILGEQAA